MKVNMNFLCVAIAALALISCTSDGEAPQYATQAGALTLSACDLASSKSISVPSQCPTVQAAVDHAAAGAVITVAAGTYNENVVVTKVVAINGAGASTCKLVGPLSTAATVHYGAGGGGTLSGFSVLGGSAAIDGGDVSLTGLAYPAGVTLKNLTLTTTPYGLKGYFGSLSLQGVTITKATSGGASLQTNYAVSLTNSTVSNNSVLGFSVKMVGSGPPKFTASGSTFSGNSGTGLSIRTAGLGSASFSSVVASNNVGDGIDCTGISSWLNTDKLSATGNGGNGVRLITTDKLWLFGGPFSGNGKSGVSASAANVWFSGFTANNNSLYGVDVALTGADNTLSSLTTGGNLWGGMRLSGSAATASLSNLTADSNRIVGVLVQNFGNLAISGAKMTNTLPQAGSGKFGDGIVVVASKVGVSSSTIKQSARAGISAWGCNGSPGTYGGALLTISSTLFYCDSFAIDLEQGSGGWASCPVDSSTAGLDDGGGNYATATCNPNPATPGGTCTGTCPGTPDWGPVKAMSSSLEPLSLSSLPPPGA